MSTSSSPPAKQRPWFRFGILCGAVLVPLGIEVGLALASGHVDKEATAALVLLLVPVVAVFIYWRADPSDVVIACVGAIPGGFISIVVIALYVLSHEHMRP